MDNQESAGSHAPQPTDSDDDGTPRSLGSIDSVMADYIERIEDGKDADPAGYLKAYPEYADELRSFFCNHHWLGDAPTPESPSLVGTEIGPYTIESEIARGGMGIVYRASQSGLDRPVALKLISSGVLAGEEERKRFRIEAAAAARLHHPGIIAIHEIGSWQGYEYFSMALIEGPTLQQWVDDRVFDDAFAATTVRDIARAVQYAHVIGIVHRDLKPENILLQDATAPLVTDFGLAKWHREGTMLTRTGQVLGTPHYMSPEQASGRADGDAQTDVYSMGAILYALLTGRPPHEGQSAAEVLRSVLQDEPPNPRHLRREIPTELEAICLHAIRYDNEERYATAAELADDLDRYLNGEPPKACHSGLLDRFAREIRRDQHQDYFEAWGRTLVYIGIIVFVVHVVMFALERFDQSNLLSYFLPRTVMLVAIFAVVFRAREGVMLPRSVAERPVWSIWLGYLATLTVMNLVQVMGAITHQTLFTFAAAMSGFGFLAMAGHVWGGSAILGATFLAMSVATVVFPTAAPLLVGTTWLISLCILGKRYRTRRTIL